MTTPKDKARPRNSVADNHEPSPSGALGALFAKQRRRDFIKGASALFAGRSLQTSQLISAVAIFNAVQPAGVRQITLMVESSGLGPDDRVVEVGAVELIDRTITGRHFHVYLDPECNICPGAETIHGLNSAFLDGKLPFAAIAESLLAFVGSAQIITHSMPFHIGFLKAELARTATHSDVAITNGVVDTLRLARQAFPGQRNDLDSLVDRLNIDHTRIRQPRNAMLVAEAYLAMSGRPL